MDQAVQKEPEFLTAKQLAKMLNVSEKAIWKWRGRLPAIKMGRLVRFSRHEIEKRLLTGTLLVDKM